MIGLELHAIDRIQEDLGTAAAIRIETDGPVLCIDLCYWDLYLETTWPNWINLFPGQLELALPDNRHRIWRTPDLAGFG
jgi:hypothetical protein